MCRVEDCPGACSIVCSASLEGARYIDVDGVKLADKVRVRGVEKWKSGKGRRTEKRKAKDPLSIYEFW